jgi:hypothetical protein
MNQINPPILMTTLKHNEILYWNTPPGDGSKNNHFRCNMMQLKDGLLLDYFVALQSVSKPGWQ